MASLGFTVNTAAEVALSAATAKSVLRVKAPSSQRVKVKAFGIYFDGTSATAEPVTVQLVRQTTDGTFTSATPRKIDDSIADSINATAGYNASVEPTDGDILKEVEVHPQRGYEWHAPLGMEPIIGGGDRLAIKANAPAGVNCHAWMLCEE